MVENGSVCYFMVKWTQAEVSDLSVLKLNETH